MKWTPADQRNLDNLLQRKEAFETAHRKVLEDLVVRAVDFTDYQGASSADILHALIEHADAFRDALQPFDSGVRPAQPQTP